MEFTHQPVLLNAVIDALKIKKSGLYIDGTFGRGGHSKEILRHLGPTGKLLVIDRDVEAVRAAERLKDPRLVIRHGSFGKVQQWTEELGWTGKVDGMLLDLGVSSPQLDDAQRGFSFREDGPLDMRMDQTKGQTLEDFLESVSEERLRDVIRNYGEEKFSRQIARAIVTIRRIKPIASTIALAEVIKSAVPKYDHKKHPATRTFQALRIALNNELEELAICLKESLKILKVGGRLLVISFHSLEDHVIKNFVRKSNANEVSNLQKLPLRQWELAPKKITIVGKTIKPDDEEISINPRSRSAKLTIMERIL